MAVYHYENPSGYIFDCRTSMLDCCLGVVRSAKSHPGMSRLTRGEFVWSGGVMATEVIQNYRLI